MKVFNGSKGPWSAHDDEESMATSVVMNEFGDILCGVGTYMTSTEEDYANANLIAAAPDLLEALQAAMDYIDAIPKDVVLPAMPGFDRDWVDGVISKALGEE